MNGDNNGGHNDDEAAFTDVKLEVPSSSPNEDRGGHVTQQHISNYDRGERVKGEIAMLSPMQHPPQPNNSSDTSSDKSRPEDFNIKSFVPTKPLPIPTPSR